MTKTISFITSPLFKNKSFLHQKYVVERLSTTEIAALIFSSHSTVLAHLKKFGIPVRASDEKNKGQLGYGEAWRGRQLSEHKRELRLVKKMKKMREEGLSYGKIAGELNSRGVPTKSGHGRWHSKTIYQILSK